MENSSFAIEKNETEIILNKMDTRYKDKFKDVPLVELDLNKKYYYMFIDGVTDVDFKKTGRLKPFNTTLGNEPLPLALMSDSQVRQPKLLMPNGTMVNLAANATSSIDVKTLLKRI